MLSRGDVDSEERKQPTDNFGSGITGYVNYLVERKRGDIIKILLDGLVKLSICRHAKNRKGCNGWSTEDMIQLDCR